MSEFKFSLKETLHTTFCSALAFEFKVVIIVQFYVKTAVKVDIGVISFAVTFKF